MERKKRNISNICQPCHCLTTANHFQSISSHHQAVQLWLELNGIKNNIGKIQSMGHLFFFFLNKYKITSSYWVCLVGRAGMMQLSSTGLNNYYSYHLKARWWWQFLFISRFFWIFSLSGQTFPLRRCWSHW